MVEAQTPCLGDGLCTSGDHERAASAILSLFDVPGGVVFSYLVIIKSMTHTRRSWTLQGHSVKTRKFKI
jgi:hypothetical protein